MGLNVEQNERSGCAVITVRGEVDLYSSPDLRTVIIKTVPKTSHQTVAVDLSEVPYMDSSGVATLVEGLQRSLRHKKAFCLLAPSTAVMKVLHLARLDAVFDIRKVL